MNDYNNLLKAAPPMRLYDAMSKIAPNSGFAKKTKKIKDMIAGRASTPTKKRKTAVKAKSNAATISRGSSSTRRSLINI